MSTPNGAHPQPAADAAPVPGLKPGDRVRLVTPDVPRLDGAEAEVVGVEAWGAHTRTAAAATGRFRAGWGEMAVLPRATPGPQPDPRRQARDQGFAPEPCPACGGWRMKRNGACLLCTECGTTTGCS